MSESVIKWGGPPGSFPPMPHVAHLPSGAWGVFNHRGELVRRVATRSLALAWTRLMDLGEDKP